MVDRRQAIFTFGGLLIATSVGALPACSAKQRSNKDISLAAVRDRLAEIEAANGGRLGVAVLDTVTGASISYRGNERFPMCSTFKFLLAGAMLDRCDKGLERLDRVIAFKASDLVEHSPVTEKFVGEPGMAIGALCEATMTTSDNTAANLLLAALGGPQAVTAFVRTIDDPYTRLDRIEPWLNDVPPGDLRDTTTPLAMLGNLDRLLIRSTLRPASRKLLTDWLVANQTGDTRLRAGLPAEWRVGDKTGTWHTDTVNDIGIIWPTGRPPILVTSYLAGSNKPLDANNAVHAEVGRAIAEAVQSDSG